MMKMRLILLAMAVAFAGSAAQAAPVLYVHYDFDDPQTGSTISDESTNSFTGTYEVGNTASAINSGPAGPVTGPTGLAGDYALPGIQNGAPGNSAVDMLQNGTSSFPTNSGAAGILKSFTFTFWFKGDITSSSGSAGRIYEALRGTPNNQTTLLFYNSTTGTDYFQANIGASGVMTSSTDAYSETNEWISWRSPQMRIPMCISSTRAPPPRVFRWSLQMRFRESKEMVTTILAGLRRRLQAESRPPSSPTDRTSIAASALPSTTSASMAR
jgi:hypothetical protein